MTTSRTGTQTHATQAIQLEHYRLLVESVQDYGIFLLDTTGHITSWNAGAKRLKGYDEHEIIGKHFSIFYTPEDQAIGKPAHKLEFAKKNGRVEDEGWRVRKDGTRFWANVVITALFDKHGALQGYAKVTRDLTDRKAMEDELAQANTELKNQQKRLMQLNQAKDEFISLASHQLRTPATGVKQYLNLILQGFLGDVPEHLLPAIQKANDSNERQIELVNNLLRVAQLDAGKVTLEKVPTDLVQLVHDILAEQHDQLQERHQKIVVQASITPALADIDPKQLRMAIENLVDNASKYTPPHGKIRVGITADQQHWRLSVKDTGVGIKAADIPRLFTKFSRIKNELSDKVGGSGLGLYWANRIVQLHDGRITVQSRPGRGTEFVIQLPHGGGHD